MRLLRRASDALDLIRSAPDARAHAPWDYHGMRPDLGHGSGFDSPGFRRTHELSPRLGQAFARCSSARGLDTASTLYRTAASTRTCSNSPSADRVGRALSLWRNAHLKVVERVIGGHVIGTQGTPVEVLGKRIHQTYYPELWDARDRLTALSMEESSGDGAPPA